MANPSTRRVLTFKCAFAKADGVGNLVWHSRFESPITEQLEEMDIAISIRGDQTNRFVPYAIKSGLSPSINGDVRTFSFNFSDACNPPFPPEQAADIEFVCTMFYAAK